MRKISKVVNLFYTSFPSPIGTLWLLGDPRGMMRLKIGGTEEEFLQEVLSPFGPPSPSSLPLRLALSELEAYFEGRLRRFSTPLWPRGTAFQKRVWEVVKEIPYGEVISYGEVASRMGNPRSARAVALALAANPLPIFIPCHRVVRTDGGLGGFSSGVEVKRWLLDFERGGL